MRQTWMVKIWVSNEVDNAKFAEPDIEAQVSATNAGAAMSKAFRHLRAKYRAGGKRLYVRFVRTKAERL